MKTKGFRDALAERGITVEEAARRSGVPLWQVRKLHNGDGHRAPAWSAYELQQALFPELSLDYLFGSEE